MEVGVAAPGFAVDDKFDLVLPRRQMEHDLIVSIAGACHGVTLFELGPRPSYLYSLWRFTRKLGVDELGEGRAHRRR